MRRMLWMIVLLSQCAPAPVPIAAPGEAGPARRPAGPMVSAPRQAMPPTATHAPRMTLWRVAGISFQGVSFDARSHRLAVADQVDGPGSRFADAAAAAASRGAIAAINGGFFDPDGQPLGRVISGGAANGPWNRASSLCSGTFHEDASGRMAIRRRASVDAQAPFAELLQAGPMLVHAGETVRGLDNTRRATRSLLIWDGQFQWWMGRSSECTLGELARAISQRGPAGWPVSHALNLDGGSSSEIWVSSGVEGGPHHSSHWWLKPARNYLLLLARKSP